MKHPSQMRAAEWRDWIHFCAKENKIDKEKLSNGNQQERDVEYEKAWKLAEDAGLTPFKPTPTAFKSFGQQPITGEK